MARVTVEDCLDKVDNRFQLVLLAAKRARHIARYPDDAKVPWANDKPTVVALREIAANQIGPSYLHEAPKTERFVVERPMPPVHFGEPGDFEDDI